MNYKTAIVNFETFFIPDALSVIMSDIKDAVDRGCDTILGLMLADGFLYTNNEQLDLLASIEQQSRLLGVKNLVLIPGIVPDMDIPGYEVIKIFNYNLHLAYLSYKNKRHLLYPWNPKADKFLFLGGVPNRPNRINLLEKFYKADLLKHAVWSFFKPWTDEQADWCRKALPDYTDDEYNNFLNACENSIDNMYEDSKEYSTNNKFDYDNCQWFKDPAWIDPVVYTNTVVSVVSEGLLYGSYSSKFLTEKTWRVFAQRHPFILAGNSEMLEYIKSLGFKTFNTSTDLDGLVSETEIFLNSYKDCIDMLNADIEHNYKQFFKLGSTNASVLDEIQIKFRLSNADMNQWFNKTGFAQLIRKTNG